MNKRATIIEAMRNSFVDVRGFTDPPQVSSAFQTAIQNIGGKIKEAQAYSHRGRMAFRITIDLPSWAQNHLDAFLTDQEKAEQARYAALAAAREASTLDKG